MIVGKLVWLQEEDRKEDISIALMDSGTILYLRALQGHSGSNLIDPTLQDNVVIGTGNIQLHLLHWMRIQSSFYYQQWIGTWRSKFLAEDKRCSSCPLIQETKNTKILNILTSLYHV